MRELRLRRLRVVLDRADAAAERDPDHHRHLRAALGAVAHLRDLADDLVVRRVDEAVELDLDHRPVAAQRHADRGADDAGLRERAVDDAVLAEVLLQAVGDPEDAAELADVLAHDQDLGVVLHRLAQAHVEALGERDLLTSLISEPPRSSRGTPRSPRAAAQLLGLLGVHVVEHGQRLRVGQRLAALAQVVAELVGLGAHRVEERVVGQAVALEVDLDAGDRVLELPALDVVAEPVAGRVVGGRVGAHPVGVGLDQRRALAVAGPLQRGLRDGVRREHVVAVDADARGSRSPARAGTAGSGSGARSARRSPTGCSGRRRPPARCRTPRR